MLQRWICLLALAVLVPGCMTTNSITNLTPRTLPRSADGLYPIEARWDSNQRSIREDSFTPYVLVGTDFYPMVRTPLTVNRWEALVPIPASQKFLTYRFKFDYLYNGIPARRPDSKLSQGYQIELTENP